MIINFMNVNRDGTPVANPDANLVADENTAKTILESTFFNNITLTFNVGNGFNPRNGNNVPGGIGGPLTVELVTYANLRNALLAKGQPNFFTDANLPAGNNIPITPGQPALGTMSNFWVSSSQAKALGIPLANPTPVDGDIGIGTAIAAGLDRVAVLLHEVGHAVGRIESNAVQGIVTHYPELDLVRFLNGSRMTTAAGGGEFFRSTVAQRH
jgi:hypothetical protein